VCGAWQHDCVADERNDNVLQMCGDPLCEAYDLAMLDLDGVVYISGHAVEHAPRSIASARDRGMKVAFVTNNAARPPVTVAEHLRELGVSADETDVVTSAQAAAGVLRQRFGSGARVAALGAQGLVQALEQAELIPVGVDEPADACVTGYGPDVVWRDVMRVASRIRGGLPWVASNTDASLPTDYGVAPGHGVMVEMISRFSGVTPTVAGKPAPPLLQETIRRVGGNRPLMVGDRLDTDIAGGVAVDVDTLLVMTGVTGLEELVNAPREMRPTYIAADLRGLLELHPEPETDSSDARGAGDGATVGGWHAAVRDGALVVDGHGSASDWWRTVATAGWRHLDAGGATFALDGVTPPTVDPARGDNLRV
jgi:HAD superfamily hydrolase (TIGR01450 family)